MIFLLVLAWFHIIPSFPLPTYIVYTIYKTSRQSESADDDTQTGGQNII